MPLIISYSSHLFILYLIVKNKVIKLLDFNVNRIIYDGMILDSILFYVIALGIGLTFIYFIR